MPVLNQNVNAIAVVVQTQRGASGATSFVANSPLSFDPITEQLIIGEYVHTESASLTEWVVNHNLNRLYPRVKIIDHEGDEVWTVQQPIDLNNTKLVFATPTQGTAYFYP